MNNNFICNRSANRHAEFISVCKRNKWRTVAEQTARCRSKVYSEFIILGRAKGSGTEDKSFAEKSEN